MHESGTETCGDMRYMFLGNHECMCILYANDAEVLAKNLNELQSKHCNKENGSENVCMKEKMIIMAS